MMAFAEAFTTKQQLMHPHCFVNYDKTWMKTVLTCFTQIIAEQPSLTQYERPMYHMKEEKKMLSSFSFSFFFFNSHYIDGFYFTWPLRKQAAYKHAPRGPTALSPFRGTMQ